MWPVTVVRQRKSACSFRKHALKLLVVPAARSRTCVQARRIIFHSNPSIFSSLIHVFCIILVRSRACIMMFHFRIHRVGSGAICCLPLFAAHMSIESALSVRRLVRFFGLLLLVLLIRDSPWYDIRQKLEVLYACHRIGWEEVSEVSAWNAEAQKTRMKSSDSPTSRY